jgi:hypothetical protein
MKKEREINSFINSEYTSTDTFETGLERNKDINNQALNEMASVSKKVRIAIYILIVSTAIMSLSSLIQSLEYYLFGFFVTLPFVLILALFVYHFIDCARTIAINFSTLDVFDYSNVYCLRKLSKLLIGCGIYLIFTGGIFIVTFIIIIGTLFNLMARALEVGIKMKEENELTI